MAETVVHTNPDSVFWILFGLFFLWAIAWDKLETARYHLAGRLAGAHTVSNLLLNARLMEDTAQQRVYIAMLTELVRYSYEKQTEAAVSLQEELEKAALLVSMYNLSHSRKVQWKPDERLQQLEMELPPFSLLCLVENALAHGVGPSPDNATIHITPGPVKRGMQAISLSGYGMPQARMLKRPPKGHGLHYLYQRLYRFCVAKSSHYYYEKPVVKGNQLVVLFPV